MNMHTDFDTGSILIGADMSCNLYGDADCADAMKKIRDNVNDVRALMVFAGQGDNKVKKRVASYQCYVETSE